MEITTHHLHARSQPGVIVIDLLDRRIVEHSHIENVAHELFRVAECDEGPNLIINFEHVEFLSSTMLSVLVALLSTTNKHGGEIRLAGLSENLQSVFRMTKLINIFLFHDDVDAALADLPRSLAASA